MQSLSFAHSTLHSSHFLHFVLESVMSGDIASPSPPAFLDMDQNQTRQAEKSIWSYCAHIRTGML